MESREYPRLEKTLLLFIKKRITSDGEVEPSISFVANPELI